MFSKKEALRKTLIYNLKKKGFKKMLVISGIGVREYYERLGYELDKEKIYVEKKSII